MADKEASIPRRLWRFFGSLRVLFWLLTATALISLVGAFILQQGPAWAYVELYGEGWSEIIFALGANDLFHTPYFILLLAWLTVSSTVCGLRSLRGRRRAAAAGGAFRPQRTLTLTGEPRQFLSLTSVRLKRRSWTVRRDDEALYAERGRWAWWTSAALHLGTALLILAGALKLLGGDSATLVLFEDQVQLVPPHMAAGLEVSSPDFGTLTDPNSGRVLSYYTELEVRVPQDGAEEKHHLEVNLPYRRDGLAAYQSFVDEIQPVELYLGPPAELTTFVEQLHAYQRSQAYPLAVELRLEPLTQPPPTPAAENLDLPVPEEVPLEETGPAAAGTVAAAEAVEAAAAQAAPAPLSRNIRVPLEGGPTALPGGYDVEVLGFDAAALTSDGTPAPAVTVRLTRNGEVIVDGARVFARRFGGAEGALEAGGYAISLGRVIYTSTPRPELPAAIERHRLYGGETGGAGTWLRPRGGDGQPLHVAFAVHEGLLLRRGLLDDEGSAATPWTLPASLDADPTAVIALDDETAAAYRLGEPEPISGLELKRDPGLWLFWPGVALLTIGSVLFVLFPHRRLWLRLEDNRVMVRSARLTEGRLRKLLSPEGGGQQ